MSGRHPAVAAPRRLRARAAALGVVSALVLATACSGGGGGGGEGGAGDLDPAPTPTAVPSPTPEPEPTSPVTLGVTDYLPTPSGTRLTDPGSRLALGEAAVVAWLPSQDVVGVVDLEVRRITRSTVQDSLAGFDLSAVEQRSTPYFVDVTVTNVGGSDLGRRVLPLYLLDEAGTLVAPTGVARDFEPCPRPSLPREFTPGERTRGCLIFLAPPGTGLQSIMFRPPDGVPPMQWTEDEAEAETTPRRGQADDEGSRRAGRRMAP